MSFQGVFSINLDGPLADGDCGSAVFDAATGELFGLIVAGCRTTGFAYVMAAHHVFPSLRNLLRKSRMSQGGLPALQNPYPRRYRLHARHQFKELMKVSALVFI